MFCIFDTILYSFTYGNVLEGLDFRLYVALKRTLEGSKGIAEQIFLLKLNSITTQRGWTAIPWS